MLGLRRKVVGALGHAGVFDRYLRWQRRLRVPRVTVVTYHRVTNAAAGDLDDGVIDATVDEFEQHLETLQRNFHVIPLDALLTSNPSRIPQPAALVTFDDGYRDCFDIALPILARRRVPATFFVSTVQTEERRLFWWDVISLLVKGSQRESITLSYPRALTLDFRTDRDGSLRALLRIVKTEFALDLDRFLDELAKACDVVLDPDELRAQADSLLMTWDQIRKLKDEGMRIESHTRTHRVLQTLPNEDLDRELRGSREELAAQLGSTPSALAFPVGYSIKGDARIRDRVRSAGYKVAFSNRSGTNMVSSWDLLDISRVSTERGMSPTQFSAMLAAPQLIG